MRYAALVSFIVDEVAVLAALAFNIVRDTPVGDRRVLHCLSVDYCGPRISATLSS